MDFNSPFSGLWNGVKSVGEWLTSPSDSNSNKYSGLSKKAYYDAYNSASQNRDIYKLASGQANNNYNAVASNIVGNNLNTNADWDKAFNDSDLLRNHVDSVNATSSALNSSQNDMNQALNGLANSGSLYRPKDNMDYLGQGIGMVSGAYDLYNNIQMAPQQLKAAKLAYKSAQQSYADQVRASNNDKNMRQGIGSIT